jgi:microcystin degradation protein MlrC
MARIAVGGFQHETNTFVSTVTDYEYFCLHRDRPPLVRRGEVLSWLGTTSFALSGFMRESKDRHELVPLIWTSGGAGGYVTRNAYERIAAEMVAELSAQLPVDAIYLDLHGAMVGEDFEDGEGELLRRIRATVGRQLPLVVSLDYHANVTPQMTELSDAMIAYRTYPHVDRVETGARAAWALDAILAGGQPGGRALRKVPFLIPLHAQCTTIDPSKAIVSMAQSLEKDGHLSVSYLAGFPPSDIYYAGPAVVVHSRTQEQADAAADALAREIALREPQFSVPLYSPEEAIARAKRLAERATKPVILADTQDNPGAGGSADTTGILAALVRGEASGAVLGFLCDPAAVETAREAGQGAEIKLRLGGRHGPAGVEPFDATFRVMRLGDGKMRTAGPVSGGRDIDLGPMALLTIGGVGVAVTTKRMQALDQAPFRHLGIDPREQKILALKSTVHFRAEFEPIAEEIMVVVAPGAHLCDPSKYSFKRLRPGIRLSPLGPEARERIVSSMH